MGSCCLWDEIEAESTGLVAQVAFAAFAILVLLPGEQVVVVLDMVRDEVVDDASYLVGGGGDCLWSAEAGALAAKVILRARSGSDAASGLPCVAPERRDWCRVRSSN